jgi:hypothetical protein
MRLVPISTRQMRQLVPRSVSTKQWQSYWGVNSLERLQKVLESLLISYGGAWLAWFTSFMAGSLVSALIGTALIFNWMYTPWINARKQNDLIWPRDRLLSYALYTGKISRLDRIRRRAGKTVGGLSQEFLQVIVEDEKGRNLEVITQWQSGYGKLRVGMTAETCVATDEKNFNNLVAVTDAWIPSCNLWIGDYPFLDRTRFANLIATVGVINNSGPGEGARGAEEWDEGIRRSIGAIQLRQPSLSRTSLDISKKSSLNNNNNNNVGISSYSLNRRKSVNGKGNKNKDPLDPTYDDDDDDDFDDDY